jgi:hypothetical protein
VTAEGSSPRETEDALRRLEERLDRASAAAERLMAEAAQAATSREPPPAGWQTPEAEASPTRDNDLDALIALARSLRELIPPDLQQRLINALREVLQAVRDLVDWYLERLDRQRAEPAEVQDIPIL